LKKRNNREVRGGRGRGPVVFWSPRRKEKKRKQSESRRSIEK